MIDLNAFVQAVKAGDSVRVQQMLDADPALLATVKQQGTSPVLLALYNGEPAVATLFIAHGATLDIFEAAATGRTERVRELVQEDPDLANAFASDGFQPLGLAAFFGHREAVELLLAYGASVNSPSHNAQKVMPLHSAVAGQHADIVAVLLDHGAKVNARQADDFTPLHGAAQNGQLHVVQFLVEHGARVNLRNSKGRTPLALAKKAGHTEVVAWLREHGAQA